MSDNNTISNNDTEKPSTSGSAPTGAKKKFPPSRKGGSGRSRPSTQTVATTKDAEKRIGLTSTDALNRIITGSYLRPTAVTIDLYGSNSLANLMMQRMITVAQHPLSLLLAVAANIDTYRKVVAYLLHCRVCAAQENVSNPAGLNLPLIGLLTPVRLRTINTYMKNIPNVFAWMLTNIGNFEYESATVVPTYENPLEDAVRIQDAIRGNYESLCYYVHRHRLAGGINIPAEDEAPLAVLLRAYPLVTVGDAGNRRFTAASSALFVNAISQAEWNIFKEINDALAEQRCSVNTFSLSESIGTPVPRVRFNSHADINSEVRFYAINIADEELVRSAVILRLGNDAMVTEDEANTRFLGVYDKAVFVGSVVPQPYIDSQLKMITKVEVR